MFPHPGKELQSTHFHFVLMAGSSELGHMVRSVEMFQGRELARRCSEVAC